MKKKPATQAADEDLRAEYRFDYRRARPNPYAAEMAGDVIAVVLDPDVAAVFRTAEAVNQALRSVIAALPEQVRESVAAYARRPRRTARRGGTKKV